MGKIIEILKRSTDIIIPIIAVLASIVVLTRTISGFSQNSKYQEILLMIIASAIGGVVGWGLQITLKRKKGGKIFMSYQHNDKVIAEKIVERLKARYSNVYYDIDSIKIGDNIADAILKIIRDSDVVIIVLAKDHNERYFLNYELKAALNNGKKVLPILLSPNTQIPEELKDIKYADFTIGNKFEENIQNLIRGLDKTLAEKAITKDISAPNY